MTILLYSKPQEKSIRLSALSLRSLVIAHTLPQYSYQSVLNQRAATPRFSAFPLLVIAPQQPLTAQDYCESADIRSSPLKGERSDNQIRRYQLTRRLYCTLKLKENQTIYQRPPLNLYVFHKFASNVFLAKACENLVIRQPDNLLVGILPNPYRSSLRDGCAFLRNTKKTAWAAVQ